MSDLCFSPSSEQLRLLFGAIPSNLISSVAHSLTFRPKHKAHKKYCHHHGVRNQSTAASTIQPLTPPSRRLPQKMRAHQTTPLSSHHSLASTPPVQFFTWRWLTVTSEQMGECPSSEIPKIYLLVERCDFFPVVGKQSKYVLSYLYMTFFCTFCFILENLRCNQ